MRPEDDYPEEPDQRRRPRFEMFYWERRAGGNRYVLRMTYFAVALVAVLTLVPIVAILTFYLYQKATPVPRTPINIRVDSASPTPFRFDPGPVPTVRLPPVPTPRLRASDLKAMPPTPATTPDVPVEQPTGRPTPRPTRSPTPLPASSSPPLSPTPP
jgi:hypothetical protein